VSAHLVLSPLPSKKLGIVTELLKRGGARDMLSASALSKR